MGSSDYHFASHKERETHNDDRAQETDSTESGNSDEELEPWNLAATRGLSTEEEEDPDSEEEEPEEGGDPTPIAMINQIRLSSPMCYIQLRGGQRIKTLLDSGADVSVIQERWAKKLQYGSSLVKWDKNRDQRKCHNASGQIMDTRGTIYLNFEVGGKPFTHPFLVIRRLSQPLILGNDFMAHSDMKLDFKHRTADLQGTLIKLETKGAPNPGYFFTRVREDTIIPPLAQSRVPCRAEAEAPVGWHHISMLDVGGLKHLSMVAISGGVVELGQRRMHVAWATNSSNRPVTLKKDLVVATLTPQIREEGEEEETPLREEEVNMVRTRPYGRPQDDLSWLKMDGLPSRIKYVLERMVRKHSQLFVSKETELGRTPWVTCKLETTDEIPVQGKMYGTPLALRHVLSQKLKDLKDANLIRESNSDWTSSLLLVKKGDGLDHRVTIDYRELNKKLKRNAYPMRKIFDIIPTLQGKKYFTKLDALSGFFQIELEESSKHKTAFVCEEGVFEWNV